MASQALLEQLSADTEHTAAELVEVLHHCAAVRASADFRMLQAAGLIHDECEEDYLAAVAAQVGDGESDPAALTELALRGRVGEDPRAAFGPDGLESAVATVGAALTVPPVRARELILAGSALRYQLPLVGGMLAAGRIDLMRFLLIVRRSELVDADMFPLLDVELLSVIESREPMSMTRFQTMVDQVIARVDAGAVRKRRELVDADRSISIRPDRHTPGQSRVTARMPAEQAAAVSATLEAMAARVHPGDGRSRAQLRTDAIVALAQGRTLVCGCADCQDNTEHRDTSVPPTMADPVSPRPYFHIVVNLSTLLGRDDDPAFLDGQGVIDAATARSLLAEAKRSYLHPSHVDQARRERQYVPSPKLAEFIRSGELCCTFPGCNNTVWTADVDHTVAFGAAGGRTARRNLKPLCRLHHRVKTFATGWRDYQDELGTVFFQSPTGHMYLGNAYTGRDLFTDLRPPPKPPDHPARQRINQCRDHKTHLIHTAEKRATDQWNQHNPPPF